MKRFVWILSLAFCLLSMGDISIETYAQKKKTVQTSKKNASTSTKKKNVNNQKKTVPKTSSEAKKQQEAARKEIKQTEEQIKANEAKVKKELSELGKLDGEINETQKKIGKLTLKLKGLSSQISSLETSISKNESELRKLREEYLKAVKKMRVTKKNKSDMAFVFSSGSFNQAVRRMRYLKEFSQWRGRQTNEINSKIADLRQEREALTMAKEEQNNALTLQKTANASLESQKKEHEVLVAGLKENQVALENHLKKKQAEASELNGVISQLIAEEQRKKEEEARRLAEEKRKKEEQRIAEERRQEELRKQEELKLTQNNPKSGDKDIDTWQEKDKKKQATNNSVKTKEVKKENAGGEYASARKRVPRSSDVKTSDMASNSPESSFPSMKGRLPYPVSGAFTVTSRFGRQNLPDLPNVEYENPGIDAEVDKGAIAKAVFQGDVSGVYLLPGYHTVVILNHDGYYTVYGNIETASVRVGDKVKAGQSLGVISADEDDPSHGSIHFEVWKNREKQDPQQWLR